jgi:alkylated DNA repair dioxygenase AlkB
MAHAAHAWPTPAWTHHQRLYPRANELYAELAATMATVKRRPGKTHPVLHTDRGAEVQRALKWVTRTFDTPRVALEINAYYDGADYASFHKDNTAPASPLVIMALGESWVFDVMDAAGGVAAIEMNAGDVLVMRPGLQLTYRHAVPPKAVVDAPPFMELAFYTPAGADE